MKKQYFLMAMAATMFAACSQTEVIDEVVDNSTPKAIGFTTFADGQTRAENSSVGYSWNLEDHHTSFSVWGYKYVGTTYTSVFTEQLVKSDAAGWTYSPIRYWDKAATNYGFYAAAPTGLWTMKYETADNLSTGYFTTTSDYTLQGDNINATALGATLVESFNTFTNDKDLMIADESTIGLTTQINPVNFNFIHLLSRLNVTIKADNTITTNNEIKINSVTVNNLISTGSFNENEVAAGAKINRWTPTTDKVNYSYSGTSEVSSTALYAIQSLVMPQDAAFEDNIKLDGTNVSATSAPYITINYTITPTAAGATPETFEATYNLAKAFDVTSGNKLSFYEGYQNTLNITIKPTAITFDANVAVWDNNLSNDFTIE